MWLCIWVEQPSFEKYLYFTFLSQRKNYLVPICALLRKKIIFWLNPHLILSAIISVTWKRVGYQRKWVLKRYRVQYIGKTCGPCNTWSFYLRFHNSRFKIMGMYFSPTSVENEGPGEIRTPDLLFTRQAL